MMKMTLDKNLIKNSETHVYKTNCTEATEALGADLGRMILDEGEAAAFIALKGDLGAGKTAFVRGFASVVSPGSIVRSPTYTIVNEYRRGKFPLFHFDLYRIQDEDDLYSIGYYDYIDSGISIVEWSERAEEELPRPRYEIEIVGCADAERSIGITYKK